MDKAIRSAKFDPATLEKGGLLENPPNGSASLLSMRQVKKAWSNAY